jgi:hypothetical protein
VRELIERVEAMWLQGARLCCRCATRHRDPHLIRSPIAAVRNAVELVRTRCCWVPGTNVDPGATRISTVAPSACERA